MPTKTKELTEKQSCSNCRYFDLKEDNDTCVSCKKIVKHTRWKPDEEQNLMDSLDVNPKLKAKIKKRLETEDASNKI